MYTILDMVAAISTSCTMHIVAAIGFCGLALCQLYTILLLLTVRQNSLNNFKRLPIWIVTTGALFLFVMLVLLVYQAIKEQLTTPDEIAENWVAFVRAAYILGLVGPILDWVFIWFLISRTNDRVRSETNPAFLDTQSRDVDDYDEDERILLEAPDKVVYYEDNRMNYRRPSNMAIGNSVATGSESSPTA